MAIAFDSGTNNVQNGTTTLTFSFTNTAGNFIAVAISPDADTVTGVTYNGVALTDAGSHVFINSRYQQIWYLHEPATGANNVVISGGGDIYGRAASFSGVATSGAVSGYATNSGGAATSSTLAVTTTDDNSFVLAGGQVGSNPTAGANTSQSGTGTAQQIPNIWYSTAAVTPAGAFTINVNFDSSPWGHVGFAISPSAIEFDTYSNGSTSTTFSHTTSGLDRFLFVGITGGISDSNVTGVTYGGVAMTQIGTTQRRPASRNVTLWGLVAPTSGANNVVISLNGGDIGQSFAWSYTGVKQTSPISGAVGASGTQANISQSVTTTDDNSFAVIYAGTGSVQSAGSGTIERTNADYDGGYDSGSAITPAGAYSLNITFSNEGFGEIACAMAPAPVALVTDNFDSYTTGDLNGQGNWTATAGFGVVQTSVVQGGANAVSVSTWNGTKTLDNALGSGHTLGTQSFYFQVSAVNVNVMYVQFREIGPALRFAVRTGASSTLEVYDGSSFNNTGFSISANTWYKVTVDFTSTQVRAKLDAGSYSSFYTLATSLTGGIIQIHQDDSNPTGTLYLDTFVDETSLLTSIVSYWKLDETSDGSGAVTRVDAHSTNDLTDNNTTASGTGIINNGADFEEGNSEYLSITDASQTGLDITGDRSVSAWIKFENATNDYGVLDSKYNTAGTISWQTRIDPDAGSNNITINQHDGTTLSTGNITNLFSAGTWYHFAYSYDASAGTIDVYVDGVSVGTMTSMGTSVANSNSEFKIGLGNPGGGEYFDGIIDEVGIWSRVLTSDEITELYNSGAGLAYPFTTGTSLTQSLTDAISFTLLDKKNFGNILSNDFNFVESTVKEAVHLKSESIAISDLDSSLAYITSQLNSLEHDTLFGEYSSLVMIDATHFILAYTGDANDGYISTFSIDGSYAITKLNTFEHDTLNGQFNSLVMIDATHFILAYSGDGFDGFIKTFSIDGSYNITQIDSLEHDILYGLYNSLVMIDATHFILAYSGDGSDGFIKTFSIDGSYNITQISSLEYDVAQGEYNSLVKIDATHFILAYAGGGSSWGYIKTFSIDGSYIITELDSLEHDTSAGEHNSLVKIDDTHFILTYAGFGTDGFIKTFSIDGSYNITEIDSLEHDIVEGRFNSLVKIDATHFILAYTSGGVNDKGYIKIFSIDDSYNITQIDSLEHDAVLNYFNSLVKIDATHFILAYSGDGSDGFIKTFEVTAPLLLLTKGLGKKELEALSILKTIMRQSEFNISDLETLSLTDTGIQKTNSKTLTNNFEFAESLSTVSIIKKAFIDSFIFVEILQKITNLTFSETFSFFESLLKAYNLTQTEQFTLAESLQKVFTYKQTESFTLTDSFQKEVSSNFSELLNFTESSTTLSEFSKAITENPIISESLIKIFGLTKENSLSFLEVLSKNFFAQRTAEFSFIENISLTSEFIKTMIDSMTLAEVFSKELNKPIVESLNLAILFSSSSALKRNLSEVFSFIEILSKETGKSFDEIFNIIESSSLLAGTQQSISELVDFSESLVKNPGKLLSNSVGILDSTQLINEFTRNLTESAVLVELIKVETGLNKAESVEFADNILNIITKKFTEDASLSDIISTITSFDKTLIDVFSFIETLKKEYSIKNDEILSLTDMISTTFDANIKLSETIDILDTLIKQLGLSFSEALDFIESRIKDIAFKPVSSLELAEILTKESLISKEESITIAEALLKLFEQSQTETIDISEDIKNTVGLQNIESIEFSDSFIKEAEKQNVESISITDTFNTDSAFKRTFSTSLNITSSNVISSEKNILDLISITDSIYKSINIPKSEILIVAENDTTTTEKIKTENVTLDEALKKSYTIDLVDEASLVDTLQKLFNAELSLAEILDLTMSLSFHETDVLARGRTVLLSKQGRTVLLSKQT